MSIAKTDNERTAKTPTSEMMSAQAIWKIKLHRVVILILVAYRYDVDVEITLVRQQLWNAPECDNMA